MHQEKTAVEYHYLSLFSLLAIGDLRSKGFIGTYPTNCAPPCPWSVTFILLPPSSKTLFSLVVMDVLLSVEEWEGSRHEQMFLFRNC